MDEDDNLDTLVNLLGEEANDEVNKSAVSTTFEEELVSAFSLKTATAKSNTTNQNIVHKGNMDSSDDENLNPYNDFGKEVKSLLKEKNDSSPFPSFYENDDNTWKSRVVKKQKCGAQLNPGALPVKSNGSLYMDPVFGLRIINPLVSNAMLQHRMTDKEAVPFTRIKRHVESNSCDKDWVVGGILVRKSDVKTSQKGTPYLIWTLSDLKNDLKTISVFVFRSAYKSLWKTVKGTALAILNPSIFENSKNSRDEATLSIDNADRVMILGQSKDLGYCKAKMNNGIVCSAFINLSQCEFCIYHVQREYKKFTNRSGLQSPSGGLNALRNKVLGKNEVFYAGKSFMAIPATKNHKLVDKDNERLKSLLGKSKLMEPKTTDTRAPSAAAVELSKRQRAKDMGRLKLLGAAPAENATNNTVSPIVSAEQSKQNAINIIAKLKSKTEPSSAGIVPNNINAQLNHTSRLTLRNETGVVDLSASFNNNKRLMTKSRMNALRYVAKNGSFTKQNPMNTKGSRTNKRVRDEVAQPENKRAKVTPLTLTSEKYKQVMEAKSIHEDLIEVCDDVAKEKYFEKLERKEKMEESMMNTFKVACKLVHCRQCKYTSFSASELCKANRHELKVVDGTKRFFKCSDCANRTVSWQILPMIPCTKCGGKRWTKTSMIEQKIAHVSDALSIRGGEQTSLNGSLSGANINLMVSE